MQYLVTMRVSGNYVLYVEADDVEEAKRIAQEDCTLDEYMEEILLSDLIDPSADYVSTADDVGNIIDRWGE